VSAQAEDSNPPAGIWQELAARDRSKVFALGSGEMNIHLEAASAGPAPAVSLSPPFGDLDPQLPLRGRGTLLAELTGGAGRLHVVHGLGGCGKTRLALEAAWHAVRDGADIWWVSAADATVLTGAMRALGRRLAMTEAELRGDDVADALWRALAARTQPWLLVFDNADDPRLLAGPGSALSDGRGWLRPVSAPSGRVIVTSRDGSPASWGKWCDLHRLAVLDGTDAAGLLTDYSGGDPSLGTDAEASELAERLGGLPLALKIAGSYLAEVAGFPFPGMISSYAQYQAALDAGQFGAIFPDSGGELTSAGVRTVIGRTWELSLDLLASRGQPEAGRLLRLLATFDGTPVPYDLLLDADIMAASPLFAATRTGSGGEITGIRIWQSLKALYSFALIDMTAGQHGRRATITLHPLVRDIIGRRPDAAEQTRLAYLVLASALLENAARQVQIEPEEPPAWLYWEGLAPHALHVRDALAAEPDRTDDQAMSIAYAANFAARYLAMRGLHAQAEAEFAKLVADWRRINGPDSEEVLVGRHCLAIAMAERGDRARADAELRVLLADELRVLGTDDLTTLATRQFLADQMAAGGDHAGAEQEYRELLTIRAMIQGAGHGDVLTVRHNLAAEMAARDDHEGALAEYRSILRARSELPGQGPDHPDALAARNQIAMELAALGDHGNALAEYREVLRRKREVLGRGHPATVITGQCLAEEMAAGDDHAAAVALLREVLADRQALAGPDSPDALALRLSIAISLYTMSQNAAAAAEFRDVLAARQRILGPAHPDTELTARWVSYMESIGS